MFSVKALVETSPHKHEAFCSAQFKRDSLAQII